MRHHHALNDHERGFLAFLAEPNRRRMETLLQLGEKRRGDARTLLRSAQLDPRYSKHLKGSDAFPGPVEVILHKRGASATCYVFATDRDLDGREMALADALEAIIGMGEAAFVSCIPVGSAFMNTIT